MSIRAVVAILAIVLAVASAAQAAPNPADLEAELVCPTCDTTLDQSNAPIAQRMKQLIRQHIAGGALPWRQDALSQRGHAIECRIYAEDPEHGFLPQAGPLRLYREPSGPGVRIDSGVIEGDDIGVHYDPLLAKLIVSAETRDAACARAIAALRAYPVLGTRTNIPFLIRLLGLQAFREGRLHTGLIDAHLQELTASHLIGQRVPTEALVAAAFAAPHDAGVQAPQARPGFVADPWSTLGDWGRMP